MKIREILKENKLDSYHVLTSISKRLNRKIYKKLMMVRRNYRVIR